MGVLIGFGGYDSTSSNSDISIDSAVSFGVFGEGIRYTELSSKNKANYFIYGIFKKLKTIVRIMFIT